MSASELKRMQKVVLCYHEQLQRHLEFIEKNLPKATRKQIELRLDDVVAGHQSFLKYQTILETHDEIKLEIERSTVEDLYYVVRPSYESQLEELNPQLNAPINIQKDSLPFTPKLPDIQLDKFSGNPTMWPSFFESFNCLIHNNERLSNIVKFQYLKNSLQGCALQTISSLDFIDDNYNTAIELLQARFDNKRLICEEHIKALFVLKSLDKACHIKLNEILDTFNSHIRSLQSLKRPTQYWDDLLVYLISSKFDPETKAKWIDFAPSKRLATFEEISDFIRTRCQKLESQSKINPQPKVNQPIQRKPFPNVFVPRQLPSRSFHATTNQYHCTHCKNSGHSIMRCTKFKAMSVDNRRKAAESAKICFNCLQANHFSGACPNSDVCRVCQRKHHTLLHLDTSINNQTSLSTIFNSNNQSSDHEINPQISPSSTTVTTLPATASSSLSSSSKDSYIFLATALIEVYDIFGNSIVGRALLDSGSQLNFISQAFANLIGTTKIQKEETFSGIGVSSLISQSRTIINIKSRTTNYSTTLETVILPTITGIQPSMPYDSSKWPIPSNINLADPNFHKPQRIDILIGAEIYFELLSVGQIKIASNLPLLQNTVLGWIVSGPAKLENSENKHTENVCNVALTAVSSNSLNEQIEKFWKLESIPNIYNSAKLSDHEAEEHFCKTFSRDSSGRFIVRLPFLEDPIILGDSHTLALRRYLNLEKRFFRNPDLYEAYKKFITEYLKLDHMALVPEIDIRSPNYYFPHHCVFKLDSSSTQLRVVFDGSALTISGKSLNNILMVGPIVQNDLFSVLCRFRSHTYAFSADISKMYRQIKMHNEDQQFQYIFWRDELTQEIRTYKLKTVTYGSSCAPYLATRCLYQLSIEFESHHPIASKAIRQDTYVDDLFSGAESIQEAKKLKSEIIHILSSAGMELRKWSTNKDEIIADIPEDDREQLLHLNNDDYIKTLGILWQPVKDLFQVKVNMETSTKITKRIVISELARIFDPLGFVSPVIVLGKLFMQRLWKLKLDWDDTYWQTFRNELCQLENLVIPRHLFGGSENYSNIQLHGFADASEVAYGAAVYTRSLQVDGKYVVTLFCSKSKVFPLQKTTLPRLELCAAQLLAQLMSKFLSITNFNVEQIFYWSDSTIVLNWIKSCSSNWNTFVANRVASIQELSDPNMWLHVNSSSNPADKITRGLMPEKLINCDIWFSGPDFLHLPNNLRSTEPQKFEEINDMPERKKSAHAIIATNPEDKVLDQIKYRNDYPKLMRVVAYIQRFISNSRIAKENRKYSPLDQEDFDRGLVYILRAVQAEAFPLEQTCLENDNFKTKNKFLQSLSLFLDNDGIIRVGDRLQFLASTYSTKHSTITSHNYWVILTILQYFTENIMLVVSKVLGIIVRE